jgi:hypothetical protein
VGRVATTLAGLGDGFADGDQGAIRTASGRLERFSWHEDIGLWVGREHTSMFQVDGTGEDMGIVIGGGSYPGLNTDVAANPAWSTDSSAFRADNFGFGQEFVQDMKQMFDAGFVLQEHLVADLSIGGDPAFDGSMWVNWFGLDQGASFLSPAETNHGLPIGLTRDDPSVLNHAWFSRSSGWQYSPVSGLQDPAAAHGYPEWYGQNLMARRFCASYRWVSGVVGVNTPDKQDKPPIDSVFSLNLADDLSLPHGAAVSQWSDYAGFGATLSQPNPTFQPVIDRTLIPGHSVVLFDGVDDRLNSPIVPNHSPLAQPLSVFMVLKQFVGGPAQQVWISGGSAGGASAPIFYRGDGTDQVDLWLGTGGDMIYHRSSAWPSPFMVMSYVANGANSTIWEDKTLKAGPTDDGSAGWGALAIGAEPNGTLPAHIAVAAMIVVYRAVTDTERRALVDWLRAKCGLPAI